MISFTLYAVFWMVLIALSSNLYSHTCMCVCKFFFIFIFYRITLSEPTLQTNTICNIIYTFGCSLNVRQKERSRSLLDNLIVCQIVLCCFIHIFFSFTVLACSVFFSNIFTGISNPTVLALKQLWKCALFMD